MAVARPSLVFLCSFGLVIRRGCAAEPFLQKQSERNEDLLISLQAVLGPESLRGRLDKLEARLRPTFLSLPKNAHNLLSHAAARYALHRLNVDLHGYSISGLEPNATTFNTTSLVGSGMLRGFMPEHIEIIFERHISDGGFGLRDLALLAGTIEHIVHDDQKSILRRVCEWFDLPTVGPMKEEAMMQMIYHFKAVFLLSGIRGKAIEISTPEEAQNHLQEISFSYPGWRDTTLFLDDERKTLVFNERDQTNPFKAPESSLRVALRVVEQAAGHFARKQAELECQEIREDLLAYERGDSGRIRLSDFYRAGLDARFFFVETKEYLRALGVLDDSDSSWEPKVIVSNYVLAKSNCLTHSHIYSICCINECESLYRSLEENIAVPEGTPEQVASLVAKLSSSTVSAPRNLSQPLLRRLGEIAFRNNGGVLLHGRLFAQWMHQAFPRECPYPHLTGTTTSLSPTAWAKQNGVDYRIDAAMSKLAALNHHIELESPKDIGAESVDTEGEDLMWSLEEEQFAEPTRSLVVRVWFAVHTFSTKLCLVVVLAFCVICALIAKARPLLCSGGGGVCEDKLFV